MIHLSSWVISVDGITSSSLSVRWLPIPIGAPIQQYLVNYKGEHDGGILKFKGRNSYFPDHDQVIFVQWLEPYTIYEIQVLALTGSIMNYTYSSNKLSIITCEEGRQISPETIKRNFSDISQFKRFFLWRRQAKSASRVLIPNVFKFQGKRQLRFSFSNVYDCGP